MVKIPEYVIRMTEELEQLDKRIDKLQLFMLDTSGISEEKRMLMQIQLNAMAIYREVLWKRLDICAKECNNE